MKNYTKTELSDIASKYDLELIETTSNGNGYPENLSYALIGFDNWTQLEEIAEEYNLQITDFMKKDGWKLWHRKGNTITEPYDNLSENFGSDCYSYISYGRYKDEQDFFEDEVKFLLDDCSNFKEVADIIEQKKWVWSEVQALNEGQCLIIQDGEPRTTIDEVSLTFYHDTKYLSIGLAEKY